MTSMPELAPANKNKLLGRSSVITSIYYAVDAVQYKTYDTKSSEILRLKKKPSAVSVNGKAIDETTSSEADHWSWKQLNEGGVLEVQKTGGNKVEIRF
jgi:hypothetical protein